MVEGAGMSFQFRLPQMMNFKLNPNTTNDRLIANSKRWWRKVAIAVCYYIIYWFRFEYYMM